MPRLSPERDHDRPQQGEEHDRIEDVAGLEEEHAQNEDDRDHLHDLPRAKLPLTHRSTSLVVRVRRSPAEPAPAASGPSARAVPATRSATFTTSLAFS